MKIRAGKVKCPFLMVRPRSEMRFKSFQGMPSVQLDEFIGQYGDQYKEARTLSRIIERILHENGL